MGSPVKNGLCLPESSSSWLYGKVKAAVINDMLDGFSEQDWKENSSLDCINPASALRELFNLNRAVLVCARDILTPLWFV